MKLLKGTEKVKEYKNQVTTNPLVSVCVVTYKHEEYIEACLDSILMQETNFDVEILLGEDNSPDKTRQICIKYAEKYPEKIRLFLHDRSNVIKIGGKPTGRYNFTYNLEQARGKYIAFCEGDDYWLDTNKLKKQIDFLSANPDYVMCSHDAKIVIENELTKNIFSNGRVLEGKGDMDIVLKDILSAPRRIIHLASLCVNGDILRKLSLDDWFFEVPAADLPLTSLLTSNGKAKYMNDLHCIYRQHKGGLTNRAFDEAYYKQLEYMFQKINEAVGGHYSKEIAQGLKGRRVMFHEVKMGEAKSSRKFWMYFKHWRRIVALRKYTNHSWRDLFWILRQYFK